MVQINDAHFLRGSLKSLVSDMAPAGATGITLPRWAALNASAALVSGTPVVRAIELPIGINVNNLSVMSITAETLGTHFFMGLLDNELVLRAVSADDTSGAPLAGSGAVTTKALTSGGTYNTPYEGIYYALVCASFTGTAPTLVSANLATGVAIVPPAFCGSSGPTQSTPPALGTQFSAISGGGSLNFLAWTT